MVISVYERVRVKETSVGLVYISRMDGVVEG